MSFWLKLDRFVSKVLIVIAGVFLGIMVAAVVGNVFGRIFFGAPLWGTVEIISLAGLFVVSFALGYTERNRRHILVTIILSKLPQRLHSLFAALWLLICLGMAALLIWGGFWMAMEDATTPGATTYVLHLSKAPFRFAWVLSCLVLWGFLLQHLLEVLDQVRKK